MRTVLRGHDIICIAGVAWDTRRLSLHQYMRRMATANRVLWVDPAAPLPRGARRGTGSLRHVVDGLFVATPPARLPLRFERPVAAVNQTTRAMFVRRAARRLGLSSPVLWLHDPDAAGQVRRLAPRISVAFLTDDHPTRHTFRSHRGYRLAAMRARERELLRAVDLVIATSPELAEAKRAFNANCHCVMHGVDSQLLGAARRAETQPAPAVAALPAPVLGIVGQVNWRIDTALVADLARARPEWSLAFVGPVWEPTRRALSGVPNLHLLGEVPQAELPRWIKPMAVGLIPYVLDEHTRQMHPLKALEYLAAGKPVVATALPALKAYWDHIEVVGRSDEFARAIERALAEDGPERAAERARYAAARGWERGLEEISELVEVTGRRGGR